MVAAEDAEVLVFNMEHIQILTMVQVSLIPLGTMNVSLLCTWHIVIWDGSLWF
jgi:hypothetical protein